MKKHVKKLNELKATMLDTLMKTYLTVDDKAAAGEMVLEQLAVYEDLLLTYNETASEGATEEVD